MRRSIDDPTRDGAVGAESFGAIEQRPPPPADKIAPIDRSASEPVMPDQPIDGPFVGAPVPGLTPPPQLSTQRRPTTPPVVARSIGRPRGRAVQRLDGRRSASDIATADPAGETVTYPAEGQGLDAFEAALDSRSMMAAVDRTPSMGHPSQAAPSGPTTVSRAVGDDDTSETFDDSMIGGGGGAAAPDDHADSVDDIADQVYRRVRREFRRDLRAQHERKGSLIREW